MGINDVRHNENGEEGVLVEFPLCAPATKYVLIFMYVSGKS